MRYRSHVSILVGLLVPWGWCAGLLGAGGGGDLALKAARVREALGKSAWGIMTEAHPGQSWDLVVVKADGSGQLNITQTEGIDELYPHVSPDGQRVVFVADENNGFRRVRSVYYMNVDGSSRVRVAENGRQPCWSPNGGIIAFMRAPSRQDKYYETEGLYFYNLRSGRVVQHPNENLRNLLNLCWSPNGQWIVASVFNSMGYTQSILAIEANGNEVVNLIQQDGRKPRNIYGCRPDFSADGRWLAWSVENLGKGMWIAAGQVDFSQRRPRVGQSRMTIQATTPTEVYHADWSPDGRFIAFSSGPRGPKMKQARFVGGSAAAGWNIGVVDVADPRVFVMITTDGLSYKEPDWFRLPAAWLETEAATAAPEEKESKQPE